MFSFRIRSAIAIGFLLPILSSCDHSSANNNNAGSIPPPIVFDPEFRSIDGTGNNLVNPSLDAAAGIQLKRRMSDHYADHFSQMPDHGNPRDISNKVSAQSGDIFTPARRSDFLWQWGQFLDHDIGLTGTTSAEPANIVVPANDPIFGSGTMGFDRSVYDTLTGVDGPRQQINEITAYIDASNVYGSDPVRAGDLRSLDSASTGLLKTSQGDLLPFDEDGIFFFAGDVRANEQIALTAMHTLFVREHNRLASMIVTRNPELIGSGDQIYELARRLVGAEIQAITYNEFIPALLGSDALSPYRGYDSSVDAGIMNEFSAAAFRFGHSVLSPKLLRLDPDGQEIPAGHVRLRNAFFNPDPIIADGIEPILRGLASQVCQAVDVFVIDEVRNFLFAPLAPETGGFDLVSLNIQRGRDHGLPTYNEARMSMGMSPATDFADVSSDQEIAARLANAYATVDDIDMWTGGLAEDHIFDAMVGELFFGIITEQLEDLRDGDRFWYQISLSAAELEIIENTHLSDIIIRNTDIREQEIQKLVFIVEP